MLRARDAAPRQVEECLAVLDDAVAHIRGLSQRLRPPMLDDLGLGDALEWVLEQQAKAAGWRSTFEAVEMEDRLPPDIETACFRIAQEALTNAARHAKAREVAVILRLREGNLALTVSDDGDGFDPARYATAEERRQHFGLLSMAERASLVGGRLEIDSAAGRGTRVTLILPLPSSEPVCHGADEGRSVIA